MAETAKICNFRSKMPAIDSSREFSVKNDLLKLKMLIGIKNDTKSAFLPKMAINDNLRN